MVRAYRYFLPGYTWHLTQRCHKREFLLKFARDRRRWRQWLFQAKQRYGLRVLNYMVTSNHIHLLVYDDGRKNVIPRSMQLISGRVGQEYNQRKSRNGSFWGDRYHATAIESGLHLMRCLVYLDLNMVRAGIVKHPSEWECSGYHELQNIPERKRIIDYTCLIKLLELNSHNELKTTHQNLIHEALNTGDLIREEIWTESLAVGSQSFVEDIKRKLGVRGQYRPVSEEKGSWEIREETYTNRDDFNPKISRLRHKKGGK